MASPAIAPLHAARLAQLEGALLALLRAAGEDDTDPNDMPDGLTVRLEGGCIDLEYTRGGIPVAGESL